jgi:outer membrane protein assembly factor BamE (lipoprotein component of BamABCDE complex)
MKLHASKMLFHVRSFYYLISKRTDTTWLTVAEKLKQEGRHEIFEQETMEEFEDDDGNVYNRKTYEDLKKQGLI